jgi:hypothetical protein
MADQLRRIPDWLIVLAGTVIIALLGIYVYQGISAYMDIQLSDETKYMTGGMNFFNKVPKGWGPMYSFWYRILYFVEKDTIDLYYLNFKVLATGVSILLFWLLVRMRVHMLIAFFIGACFLFADLNIFSWPRISHFAAAAVMITVLISTCLKSTYLKLVLFSIAALAISLARPEIGLSFMILVLLTGLWVLYKRFRLNRAEWLVTLAILPIAALFFLKMGVPMIGKKGSAPNMEEGNYPRSVTAYGQHFYLNYTEWSDQDEIILFYWDTLFKQYYEVHPSLLKTLSTNIPITIKHISVNTRNYISKAFNYTSGVFLPDKILYLPAWLKLILVLGALAVINYLIGWRKYRENIAGHLNKYATEYIGVFVLAIPTLISCTLIYPREHYIMLQIPLLFMIAAPLLFIHFTKVRDGKVYAAGMAIIGLLLFLLMPDTSKLEQFNLWQARSGPVNLSAVHKLNEIGIEGPYTVIVNEGNIDPYLDNPDVFSLVGYQQLEGLPFDQAVDSFNIRVVYVTSLLESDPWFNDDEAYLGMIEDPSSLGFRRIELATPYSYLLVDETVSVK